MKFFKKPRLNRRVAAGIIAGLLIITLLFGLVAPFIVNIRAEEVEQCYLID